MPENTLSARIKFGIIIIIIIGEIGVVSSSAQALQFREATQSRLEFSQSQRAPDQKWFRGFLICRLQSGIIRGPVKSHLSVQRPAGLRGRLAFCFAVAKRKPALRLSIIAKKAPERGRCRGLL